MQSLADGFARRTVADGRLVVGVSRTKRLTELIQWVSDFKRVGEKITIAGLNKASFHEAILFSAGHAANCQAQKAAQKSSDDSTTGKLKDDRKWNTWITAFYDMLQARLGVSGVPLSYIIRENDDRNPQTTKPTKRSAFLTHLCMDPILRLMPRGFTISSSSQCKERIQNSGSRS